MSKGYTRSLAAHGDCEVCGKRFRKRTKTHVMCSEACRKKRYTDDRVVNISAHSDRAYLGAAAEHYVIADLILKGHFVFNQVGTTGPADLVVVSYVNQAVAFINVRGRNSIYVKNDGSYSLPSDARDPKNPAVWMVHVVGTEIHYPDGLVAFLGFLKESSNAS